MVIGVLRSTFFFKSSHEMLTLWVIKKSIFIIVLSTKTSIFFSLYKSVTHSKWCNCSTAKCFDSSLSGIACIYYIVDKIRCTIRGQVFMSIEPHVFGRKRLASFLSIILWVSLYTTEGFNDREVSIWRDSPCQLHGLCGFAMMSWNWNENRILR